MMAGNDLTLETRGLMRVYRRGNVRILDKMHHFDDKPENSYHTTGGSR